MSFTLVVAMMLIGFDDSKESNSNEDHNSPLLSVLSIKDKRIMKSFAKLRGTPYFLSQAAAAAPPRDQKSFRQGGPPHTSFIPIKKQHMFSSYSLHLQNIEKKYIRIRRTREWPAHHRDAVG